MKIKILIISIAVLLLMQFFSCISNSDVNNSTISTDSATIAGGEASFIKNCSGCHNFKQDGIGPQLGGLTTEVSADWIRHFITDSKKMTESGDHRAKQLFEKYKTVMPSFATLTEEAINGIIAFLHTHKKTDQHIGKIDSYELSNPIPEPISLSNLVVGLQLMTQIPASSDSGKMPLTRITKLDYDPHSGSKFIVDLNGKLYKLQNNMPVVYMDMATETQIYLSAGSCYGFWEFCFSSWFCKKRSFIYYTY